MRRRRHPAARCWTRARLVGALVAVAAGMFAGSVFAAGADELGAAIDLGHVDVADPLRAGERYVLPTLGVRNPGTVPTDYRMVVRAVAGGPELPATWVTFSPATFALDPDARQPVEVVLHLEGDAPPGRYEALLAAQAAAPGDGNRVAAAAASRLTFTVVASPPAGGWPPWVWLLIAVAVLLAIRGLWRLRSRYQLQLVRR